MKDEERTSETFFDKFVELLPETTELKSVNFQFKTDLLPFRRKEEIQL